jgi:uncharacterized membrane protein YdbT with pleckstrin-like domain
MSGTRSVTASLFPSLPVTLQPDRSLLTYYVLSSVMLGPLFPFYLVPMYFRFRTLRYEIDEEGITMRWGILFRREVSLTFARIQDIHLTSNFVERWLGLGRIQVQTASGSAKAEMTVEGVRQYEALRNFLYERMRGARDAGSTDERSALAPGMTPEGAARLTEALTATADELRAIRTLVESRTPTGR